jgi:hypothetical protein
VHVPEATVNEHHGSARRHNDIGLARQIGAVEGEAAAEPMQNRTHNTFGRRILAANRGHSLSMLLSCRRLRPQRGRGV